MDEICTMNSDGVVLCANANNVESGSSPCPSSHAWATVDGNSCCVNDGCMVGAIIPCTTVPCSNFGEYKLFSISFNLSTDSF